MQKMWSGLLCIVFTIISVASSPVPDNENDGFSNGHHSPERQREESNQDESRVVTNNTEDSFVTTMDLKAVELRSKICWTRAVLINQNPYDHLFDENTEYIISYDIDTSDEYVKTVTELPHTVDYKSTRRNIVNVNGNDVEKEEYTHCSTGSRYKQSSIYVRDESTLVVRANPKKQTLLITGNIPIRLTGGSSDKNITEKDDAWRIFSLILSSHINNKSDLIKAIVRIVIKKTRISSIDESNNEPFTIELTKYWILAKTFKKTCYSIYNHILTMKCPNNENYIPLILQSPTLKNAKFSPIKEMSYSKKKKHLLVKGIQECYVLKLMEKVKCPNDTSNLIKITIINVTPVSLLKLDKPTEKIFQTADFSDENLQTLNVTEKDPELADLINKNKDNSRKTDLKSIQHSEVAEFVVPEHYTLSPFKLLRNGRIIPDTGIEQITQFNVTKPVTLSENRTIQLNNIVSTEIAMSQSDTNHSRIEQYSDDDNSPSTELIHKSTELGKIVSDDHTIIPIMHNQSTSEFVTDVSSNINTTESYTITKQNTIDPTISLSRIIPQDTLIETEGSFIVPVTMETMSTKITGLSPTSTKNMHEHESWKHVTISATEETISQYYVTDINKQKNAEISANKATTPSAEKVTLVHSIDEHKYNYLYESLKRPGQILSTPQSTEIILQESSLTDLKTIEELSTKAITFPSNSNLSTDLNSIESKNSTHYIPTTVIENTMASVPTLTTPSVRYTHYTKDIKELTTADNRKYQKYTIPDEKLPLQTITVTKIIYELENLKGTPVTEQSLIATTAFPEYKNEMMTVSTTQSSININKEGVTEHAEVTKLFTNRTTASPEYTTVDKLNDLSTEASTSLLVTDRLPEIKSTENYSVTEQHTEVSIELFPGETIVSDPNFDQYSAINEISNHTVTKEAISSERNDINEYKLYPKTIKKQELEQTTLLRNNIKEFEGLLSTTISDLFDTIPKETVETNVKSPVEVATYVYKNNGKPEDLEPLFATEGNRYEQSLATSSQKLPQTSNTISTKDILLQITTSNVDIENSQQTTSAKLSGSEKNLYKTNMSYEVDKPISISHADNGTAELERRDSLELKDVLKNTAIVNVDSNQHIDVQDETKSEILENTIVGSSERDMSATTKSSYENTHLNKDIYEVEYMEDVAAPKVSTNHSAVSQEYISTEKKEHATNKSNDPHQHFTDTAIPQASVTKESMSGEYVAYKEMQIIMSHDERILSSEETIHQEDMTSEDKMLPHVIKSDNNNYSDESLEHRVQNTNEHEGLEQEAIFEATDDAELIAKEDISIEKVVLYETSYKLKDFEEMSQEYVIADHEMTYQATISHKNTHQFTGFKDDEIPEVSASMEETSKKYVTLEEDKIVQTPLYKNTKKLELLDRSIHQLLSDTISHENSEVPLEAILSTVNGYLSKLVTISEFLKNDEPISQGSSTYEEEGDSDSIANILMQGMTSHKNVDERLRGAIMTEEFESEEAEYRESEKVLLKRLFPLPRDTNQSDELIDSIESSSKVISPEIGTQDKTRVEKVESASFQAKLMGTSNADNQSISSTTNYKNMQQTFPLKKPIIHSQTDLEQNESIVPNNRTQITYEQMHHSLLHILQSMFSFMKGNNNDHNCHKTDIDEDINEGQRNDQNSKTMVILEDSTDRRKSATEERSLFSKPTPIPLFGWIFNFTMFYYPL